MLTSYLVECPNSDCSWRGSLLPGRDANAWGTLVPTTNIALFQCPECQTEWQAKIVGDDVRPLDFDARLPHLV
jgi:hypothetical protein